jgi:hypothetical protein
MRLKGGCGFLSVFKCRPRPPASAARPRPAGATNGARRHAPRARTRLTGAPRPIGRSSMSDHELREKMVYLSRLMRHRGPDGTPPPPPGPPPPGRPPPPAAEAQARARPRRRAALANAAAGPQAPGCS